MSDQSKTFTSEQIERVLYARGIEPFEIEQTIDDLEAL